MSEIVWARLAMLAVVLLVLAVVGLIVLGVLWVWQKCRPAPIATPDAPQTLAEFQARSQAWAKADGNVDVYAIRRRINEIQIENRRGRAS